ncbi:HET-domain-containing protein [Dendrothele bispora CBS 962.96]|uniref:HET-domain-containing protein n=1 Tax=Dendrothele bispora (strain CBS 962.96) TaxID=1314807 RepID=A0A4S8MDI6_DENBC|nr:HET-domain-containing protein [Dendrothele bispora CBS 962.96]
MAPVDVCPHRFIDTQSLELVEFSSKDNIIIPPYAILSHTWIPEEEIIYDEYRQPLEETYEKLGYHKIKAACLRAREQNLRYIWIDTCCIKQSDDNDVAANITSMYGYYQNAEVCYVYLVDVTALQSDWPTQLRDSQWLGRGWTLQELLAPKTVLFFDEYWQYIGDKHNLRGLIHHKTTIPQSVLSGEQSIQDINVLDRMSWATKRETTKLQDQAYCLQGLLGISIKPNYDEAWEILVLLPAF